MPDTHVPCEWCEDDLVPRCAVCDHAICEACLASEGQCPLCALDTGLCPACEQEDD